MMQDLGRKYVRLFNRIHCRTGTLWEGRYKACLIDTETYLLTCHRYIELNPVRAGLTDHPANHLWSSHRHYALGSVDALVTPHLIFEALGEDQAARRRSFCALFQESMDALLLTRIRTTANQGWALGSERFLRVLEETLGRRAQPPKRGRPVKDAASRAGDDTSEMLI